MEFVVVAAFVLAALLLVGGGVVLMFFSVAVDDESELPPFLSYKIIARVVAICLAFVALGFPVVASTNERFFPWSFLFSAVAILVAIRMLLGNKAQWAIWAAAALIGGLLVSTAVFQRQ